MNIAVILAGGVGNRVGAGIPKQFIEVLGKPVICYTIEKFQTHPEVDFIEVVCVEEYIDTLKDLVKNYKYDKVKYVVKGGEDFQHSVINGVYALDGKVNDEDILLVHWAASPFISHEEISDAICVCKEKGNCIASYPAYLLYGLKHNDGLSTVEGLDRDTFMIMNAPQCFKFGYVKQMYDEAIENAYLEQVEPHTTTLMYKMKREIFFSKGNQNSIKITTKEDLDMFTGYILQEKLKNGDIKL